MLWKMAKQLFGTGRRKLFTVLGVSTMLLLFTGDAFAQDAPPTVDELARGINTVWVLVAAFLVFFMQAGFSLVEAGLTRSKNTVNILFKNLADFLFASIAYWAIGYALMFGEGSPFIGMTGFFLTGLESDTAGIPTMAVWIFQLVFAGTAATIVSGAMAERTKFSGYLIYTAVISLLIYPIFGHWVWGGGWLTELGFLDFAGSTVVHSVGGWAALMGAIIVGPRLGKFNKDGSANVIPGHSITIATLGVFILWLGWFGFNPGSQLAAIGGNADAIALVAVNTNLGAAAGGLAAMLLYWLRSGKADLGMTLNGVLGGLVAVTAPCAFITPLASIIIGLIGGVVIVVTVPLLERFKVDDPVGAVPVHLFNGIWGTIALGLFHTESGLLTTGSGSLIVAQIIGVVACGVWTAVTSGAMFYLIKVTVGLRVSAAEEEAGLDFGEHGSVAYPDLVPEIPATSTPVTSGSTVTAAS
jgi:Amt family ammonium transporter